jgi:hypothetical protein
MTASRPWPEVLDDLATMPAFLEAATHRLGGAAAARPGPGGGFSFVEQVWHLADLEREGYGERIRRLRGGTRPRLPDFDGDRIARERQYRMRAVAEGLAAFTAARQANLAALRSLTPAEWDLAGALEHIGPITLRDVPRMMAAHDASHRDEIRALDAGAPAPR